MNCKYVRRVYGFSLIELIIVVAIVAILVAIAMPNYRSYVLRSNRAVGQAELLKVASRQEQYFTNNKQYTNSLANLGLPNPFYVDDKGGVGSSGSSVYQISLAVSADGFQYAIMATPVNSQSADTDCGAQGIDNTGKKFEKVSGITSGVISGSSASDTCW